MKKIKEVLKNNWIWIIAAVALLAVFFYTTKRVRMATPEPDAFLKMFCFLSVLMGAMTILAWFLLVKKKTALQRVFLLTMTVLGLSYTMMIPVTAVPDEVMHLRFVYAVADDLMGWGSSGDTMETMRPEEIDRWVFEYNISHEYYNIYFSALTEKERGGEPYEVYYSNNHEVPHIVYLPGALGVNLGRTLHLSLVPTLLIGRFFNFLVFLAAGFFAIKLTPFGKEFLFAFSLLPMTVQEVNSFSCDCIIFAMSMLAVALTFRFAYRDVPWKKENGKWNAWVFVQWGVLALCMVLLSACKYGACVPLTLLLLLIVLRKRKTDRKSMFTAWGIFGGSLAIGFIPSICRTFFGSVVLENPLAPNYTVGQILSDPYHTFLLLMNTINRYMDHYWQSFVGTSLGLYEINYPLHIGVGFLVLLFFVMLRQRESDEQIIGKERWILLILTLLGVILPVAGMILGNTPSYSRVIEGVQGRYFLPFLVPFLFAVQPKQILLADQERTRRALLSGMVALQFVVVMCFFIRAF